MTFKNMKDQDSTQDYEDDHNDEKESDESDDSDEESESEEETHYYEKSKHCKTCSERIFGTTNDWWCFGCGYGLCARCRPSMSLAHVLSCR